MNEQKKKKAILKSWHIWIISLNIQHCSRSAIALYWKSFIEKKQNEKNIHSCKVKMNESKYFFHEKWRYTHTTQSWLCTRQEQKWKRKTRTKFGGKFTPVSFPKWKKGERVGKRGENSQEWNKKYSNMNLHHMCCILSSSHRGVRGKKYQLCPASLLIFSWKVFQLQHFFCLLAPHFPCVKFSLVKINISLLKCLNLLVSLVVCLFM